jgi:pimeloyl-ACP methyl ester carboxylesterase
LVLAAEVEVWDDCGRALQLEHPERTAGRTVDFLGNSEAVA